MISDTRNYLLIILFLSFSCKEKIDYDGNRKFDKDPSVKSQEFLKNAAYMNQAEIELGELAMSKASHDSVKLIGKIMALEHGKAQKDLIKISRTKKLKMPDTLDSPHKVLKERLIQLDRHQFDTAYINSQLNEHQNILNALQTEIKTGTYEDNLIYANKYFPYVQMHMNKLIKIQNTLQRRK